MMNHQKIYDNQITQFNQLPLPQNHRRITDCCCTVIGIIFAIVMFIVALVLFNKENINKSNYPANADGKICNLDRDSKGQSYPFIYFSDFDNPLTNRHCVKQCPLLGNAPQIGFEDTKIGIYPNHPVNNRLGAICLPDDQDFTQKLFKNAGIQNNINSLWAIDYLLTGVAISFFLGLLWMLFVQCLARFMVWVAIILAIVLLFVTALVFFFNSGKSLHSASGWAIFLGIICSLLVFVFIYYLIIHRRRIKICGEFLNTAGEMIKSKCYVVLYIFLFMGLTFGFGVLIVFQFLAYASSSSPKFSTNQLYYTLHKPWLLTFLLVIQTIWGLSFLRDSFSYCVGGCAVQWYFNDQINCCQPVKRLFCKNFGSVVGGSFLNGFLYIPSLIVSLFCDDADCCLFNIFDLVRQDIYGYIYLTGSSYCNACRQCQYLCYRSQICRGTQSTNRVYSLAARLVISLSCVLIVYWISTSHMFNNVVPPYLLVGIFFMCLFVTGYFVDIHVVISESLLITFLAEYKVDQNGYREMSKCRAELKNTIDQLQSDHKQQNLKTAPLP